MYDQRPVEYRGGADRNNYHSQYKNHGKNRGNHRQHREQRSQLTYEQIVKRTDPGYVIKPILADINGTPMKFDVIDESHLVAGSKQRIISKLLAYIDEPEVIYYGPHNGYAQVALAHGCKLCGKQATVFVDCTRSERAPLTDMATALGATIHYIDNNVRGKRLQHIREQATRYCKQNKRSRTLLPFGLNDKQSTELYQLAMAPLTKLINPKRIWVVAGSGLIFKTIHLTFPRAKLMIVQVGRRIWPDQLVGIDHEFFISPLPFNKPTLTDPPFDTIKSYDGKLWDFVLKHGQDGDHIWNTAGRPDVSRAKKEASDIDELLNVSQSAHRRWVADIKHMQLPLLASQMQEPSKMFENLRDSVAKLQPTKSLVRNYTTQYFEVDGLSNHWTEPVRMKCTVNKGMRINMYQHWKHLVQNKPDELVRIARWRSHNNVPAWRDAMYQLRVRECNTFNPLVLANIIKLYALTPYDAVVLDMSMGWGDRLLGALASNVATYIGFDPNTELHACYDRIVNDCISNVHTTTRFLPMKFNKANIPDEYIGKVDLAVTSPPFYSYELYVGSASDVRQSYGEWIKNMYTPYITDSCHVLKPGGYCAIYIDNISSVGNMADDTKEIMRMNHMQFIDRVTFQNNTLDLNGRTVTGHIRSCWVWRKPNQLR